MPTFRRVDSAVLPCPFVEVLKEARVHSSQMRAVERARDLHLPALISSRIW